MAYGRVASGGSRQALDLEEGEEIPGAADGLLRSRVFPGLWIDVDALLARDASRLTAALEKGMASHEYREFRDRHEAGRAR